MFGRTLDAIIGDHHVEDATSSGDEGGNDDESKSILSFTDEQKKFIMNVFQQEVI